MKQRLTTTALVFTFFIGLSLLLYPTLSDYYNSLHQTRAIADYTQQVSQMDEGSYDAIWEAAVAYNRNLNQQADSLALPDEKKAEYEQQLNIGSDGLMGYLEILSIDVKLPVYHGTEENVLQTALGHIEGTSLPVGGPGTHCVISGHRGLPSAKLLTDLDKVVVGDTFLLQILEETLTYEVDQILIVEPDQIEALRVEPEKDYCTLVTCTPYGINSHRLLVRGHRIENAAVDTGVRVKADAMQIDPVVVAPVLAVPMIVVLFILVMIRHRKPKERRQKDAAYS